MHGSEHQAVKCPYCREPMDKAEPGDHGLPETHLVCPDCGHSMPIPADVEARAESRPTLPGF